MLVQKIKILSEQIVRISNEKNIVLSLAESCTGGLVAGAITEISGASEILDRCAVTYSNLAKMQMLDVKLETLEKFGAVSEECAKEMAFGILNKSSADFSIAVTGIAGPNGGSAEKPVGLVFIGFAEKFTGKNKSCRFNFSGNRSEIRLQAVEGALNIILDYLKN